MPELYATPNCWKYLVNLPYPSVNIRQKNIQYATLLSGAFAGPGSEATAIAQYTAHNFFTDDYPVIAHAYRCIASVEVWHLTLLGFLVRDLGLLPKFMTYETDQYWSGSFPAYATQIKEILTIDLAGERAAIAHYTKLREQIAEPQIQALIARLILDEQNHVEILEGFINTIS